MHKVVESLVAVVAALGPWALVFVFILVTFESSAFLGLVLPGEAVVLTTGVLAATGTFSLWRCYAAVITAAILGDIAGYLLGRFYGEKILEKWTFAGRQYAKHRELIESYFRRWGQLTVVIGRFAAVGRAFTPFAAGLSQMESRQFLPMAVVGGVLWGGGLVSLGYLFGENLQLVERLVTSIGTGLLGLLFLAIAMALLGRQLAKNRDRFVAAGQRILETRAGRWAAPALARFADFVRERLSPTGYLGLHFSAGLIAAVGMAWVFGAIAQDIFAQDPLVHVDLSILRLFQGLRTEALESIAAAILFIGKTQVVSSITVIAAIGFAFARRKLEAIWLLVSLIGAVALAFAVTAIFAHFRPSVPAEEIAHGFAGFPNARVAVATAAYGMICYLGLAETESWRTKTFGVIVTFYLLLVLGLAFVYSGAMLSAVLAGYALGGFWLAVCATGLGLVRAASRAEITDYRLAER
jgi:undecaprenyl-diphosphatase